MLAGITLLLVCQLIGEVLIRGLDLPVPGPVVGMLLLFLFLLIRGKTPEPLYVATNGILRNLALLFVPASVGVVTQLNTLASDWLSITVAVTVSTMATIAVTGLVMRRLTGDKP